MKLMSLIYDFYAEKSLSKRYHINLISYPNEIILINVNKLIIFKI